jgi:hypothetical protein
MSTKQLSLRDFATPPVSAAVAILEFGRLIQEEDQRRIDDRNPALFGCTPWNSTSMTLALAEECAYGQITLCPLHPQH